MNDWLYLHFPDSTNSMSIHAYKCVDEYDYGLYPMDYMNVVFTILQLLRGYKMDIAFQIELHKFIYKKTNFPI